MRYAQDTDMESDLPVQNQADWGLSLLKDVRESVTDSLDEHPQASSEEGTNILYDMFSRAYEHTCCAGTCLKLGRAASSEALCRVSLEASVMLNYISLSDLIPTLAAYFQDYLASEMEQNRKWRNSIDSSPFDMPVKSAHYRELSKKEKAIRASESMLNNWLSEVHETSLDPSQKFANIFDRFTELGKELSYRTVYAALCSQSHADAEDIIPISYEFSAEVPRVTF